MWLHSWTEWPGWGIILFMPLWFNWSSVSHTLTIWLSLHAVATTETESAAQPAVTPECSNCDNLVRQKVPQFFFIVPSTVGWIKDMSYYLFSPLPFSKVITMRCQNTGKKDAWWWSNQLHQYALSVTIIPKPSKSKRSSDVNFPIKLDPISIIKACSSKPTHTQINHKSLENTLLSDRFT